MKIKTFKKSIKEYLLQKSLFNWFLVVITLSSIFLSFSDQDIYINVEIPVWECTLVCSTPKTPFLSVKAPYLDLVLAGPLALDCVHLKVTVHFFCLLPLWKGLKNFEYFSALVISLRTSVVSLYLQKKRKRNKKIKTSRVCLFVCCFLFVYFQKKQTYQASAFKLEITTRKNILHFLRTFPRNVDHAGHSFIKK